MDNTSTVYLNGEYLPEDQACVPVLDRGFIFGDGVYEVIPVYGGRLFRLEHHLSRLADSLAGVRIDNPMSDAAWGEMLSELVTRNGGGELSLYLQVTRGVSARDHAFPEGVTPTVFAMCSPFHSVSEEILRDGAAAITLEDTRWKFCNIKAITLLPNVLLRQQAIDAEAMEAILIRHGEVTEGAASNVFVVHAGNIHTPPKGELLLPGITRDLVLELAQAHDMPAREATLVEDDLRRADEIWITSSTKEIVPVTTLDGSPVGDGRPGPMWRRMLEIYQAYKERLRRGEEA